MLDNSLRGEYQRKTTKGLSQSGSCHQHQACTQLTDFRFQEVFHLPSGEPGEHRYSSYQAEGLVASFREAGKFRHGLPKVALVRLSRHPQARKPRHPYCAHQRAARLGTSWPAPWARSQGNRGLPQLPNHQRNVTASLTRSQRRRGNRVIRTQR